MVYFYLSVIPSHDGKTHIKSANNLFLMPLSEVVFKVTHECPFCNISKKYPSLKMFVWCNREHEVIEIISDKPEEYLAMIEEISKISKIVVKMSNGHKVHLVMTKCFCTMENSVSKNIDMCNLLHISPEVYGQGWEYYHVIAFRHEDLKELLQRLQERGFVVEVLRKVPFDGLIASSLALTADALFSDLTEKQVDALLSSFSMGYYRLPRKADVMTIASRKRVARTTFEEHLRKAENKLITSLVPYIQLFKQTLEKRERLKLK